jgi:hypothetical protein
MEKLEVGGGRKYGGERGTARKHHRSIFTVRRVYFENAE